jgi:hypothetical protein
MALRCRRSDRRACHRLDVPFATLNLFAAGGACQIAPFGISVPGVCGQPPVCRNSTRAGRVFVRCRTLTQRTPRSGPGLIQGHTLRRTNASSIKSTTAAPVADATRLSRFKYQPGRRGHRGGYEHILSGAPPSGFSFRPASADRGHIVCHPPSLCLKVHRRMTWDQAIPTARRRTSSPESNWRAPSPREGLEMA